MYLFVPFFFFTKLVFHTVRHTADSFNTGNGSVLGIGQYPKPRCCIGSEKVGSGVFLVKTPLFSNVLEWCKNSFMQKLVCSMELGHC